MCCAVLSVPAVLTPPHFTVMSVPAVLYSPCCLSFISDNIIVVMEEQESPDMFADDSDAHESPPLSSSFTSGKTSEYLPSQPCHLSSSPESLQHVPQHEVKMNVYLVPTGISMSYRTV